MEANSIRYLLPNLLVASILGACDLAPIEGVQLDVTLSGPGEGTVGVVASDAIICPDNCSEVFPVGTEIELVATPFAGFELEAWTGACLNSRTSSTTGPSRICKMKLTEDQKVDVSFSVKSKTIQVEVEGGDHGTVVAGDDIIACRANDLASNKCSATLNYGRRLNFYAQPDPGYRLSQWSGDCLGQSACGVTLTQDRRVGAEFVEDLVSVEVSQSGEGSGRIVSSPAAIDCGSNCETTVVRGQVMTLSATAEIGSVFMGWSGACAGTGECRLKASDTINQVTANFEVQYFTLTASISGEGEVVSFPAGILCGNGNRQCSMSLIAGTEIVLDANANFGQAFSEWTGDCAGTSSCVITMDTNFSVEAVFTPAVYELTINLAGTGQGTITSTPTGIDCPAGCQAPFSHGTSVELNPFPAPGSRFSGWSGACSGQEQCTVLMTDFTSAIATFEIQRHELNVVNLGLGTGSISSTPLGIDCPGDCNLTLDHDQMITLTALAEPGSIFLGWEGACTGTADCVIQAKASVSVAARFAHEYVLIPTQEFTQGSTTADIGSRAEERPPVQVRLTGNFWMKTTEVTHGEWEKLMGDSPTSFPGCGNNCPIETVSYEEATQFLNRLSDMEGYPRCYTGSGSTLQFLGVHCLGYRLPTASEWEYAARAGTANSFHNVDLTNTETSCGTDNGLSDLGWYCSNSNSSIQAVAGKLANTFGLHDMHGNVAEWTETTFDASYYQTMTGTNVDPLGPPGTVSIREIRGGSWSSLAADCRSASRYGLDRSNAANNVGFRPVRRGFSRIPAGEFKMGSPIGELGQLINETPEHDVFLSKAYWVSNTEVTQSQYEALTGSNPSSHNTCGPLCPIENVSFDQSIAYVNQLSTQAGLMPCYTPQGAAWIYAGPSCNGYRLLFESEWERAARGATNTAFFGGDITSISCSDPSLNSLGWYCSNANSTPQEVAQKTANKYGLHDVHGNVQEFVYDYYSNNYYNLTPRMNPLGPTTGTERVVRGGYYNSNAAECRSGSRSSQLPNLIDPSVGIRVGRSSCTVPGTEATNLVGAPLGRSDTELIWTGHQVLVVGGERAGVSLDTLAFDPYENKWSAISTVGAPQLERSFHGTAWTEAEALVWGGISGGLVTANGAAYNPASDTWRTMANSLTMPSARSHFSKVWTGTEWFVWGGKDDQISLRNGARYMPSEDTWTSVKRSTLSPRHSAGAVWTSTSVMVIGGKDDSNTNLGNYAFYSPQTDQWSSPFTMPSCSGKTEAIVVNGHVIVVSETGWCSYNISTGFWTSIPARPSQRAMFSPRDGIITTNGHELIVFGGTIGSADGVLDTYEPLSNTWRTPANNATPNGRLKAAGTWVGCRLFLWSDISNRPSGLLLGL